MIRVLCVADMPASLLVHMTSSIPATVSLSTIKSRTGRPKTTSHHTVPVVGRRLFLFQSSFDPAPFPPKLSARIDHAPNAQA
jgi:hypothetical protein